MGFIKGYIGKYWRLFFLAVFCLALEALCDLTQPTVMSKIIDIGVAGKRMDYVLRMGILMLGITAFGAVAATGRNILSNHVSQRFGADLRSDLFRKIQSFSFSNINRFETSTLITRLTNDVTQVQNFVNGTMRIFVKAPLLCVGSIVMASFLNPGMAPVLIAVVPIVAALIVINARIGFPFFRRLQRMLDRINGIMREYLAGVRVVKAFNRFNYETDRFAEGNEELAAVSTSALRVMAVFSPATTLAVNLGITAVVWLGGIRVQSGSMHVGQVIAFINYMTQIMSSLMMISFVFTSFIRAKASTERISEVMAVGGDLPSTAVKVETPDALGRVRFDHVSFSYSGSLEEPVLKDISFSSTQGEVIGIIGSTGSGKSTLISLIPAFHYATGGVVSIGGADVRGLKPEFLRERIAVVQQKAILFTGTITDNIKWGREEADISEISAAARAAQADGFVSAFPEGYETLLGQGGVNLSGGQKQRVSIARALVKKPEILILDDSTSSVDMATEAKIHQGIKEFAGGATCFIIAQRITSVMGCDRILVLDNGELLGMGTHQELMGTCDIYRDIYRSQIGGEEV